MITAERDIQSAIRTLIVNLARMRDQTERIQQLEAEPEQKQATADLLKKLQATAERIACHVDLLRQATVRRD